MSGFLTAVARRSFSEVGRRWLAGPVASYVVSRLTGGTGTKIDNVRLAASRIRSHENREQRLVVFPARDEESRLSFVVCLRFQSIDEMIFMIDSPTVSWFESGESV